MSKRWRTKVCYVLKRANGRGQAKGLGQEEAQRHERLDRATGQQQWWWWQWWWQQPDSLTHTRTQTRADTAHTTKCGKFDLQPQRKDEGNGRHGKKMLKIYEQAKQKVPFSMVFFSYPTCAGNGNRIIKAKLKTFTHHTKNEWQQESRKKGREEDKPDTHTRQIRKLFAKGLRRAYPTLHLTLSALPGPTLLCPACLCEWGKLFAKFVGAQIYEQTTTKLRVVVGRGGECQGRDCNPGGAGGVVESKMKCDLWSYKSKFGAWVDC